MDFRSQTTITRVRPSGSFHFPNRQDSKISLLSTTSLFSVTGRFRTREERCGAESGCDEHVLISLRC